MTRRPLTNDGPPIGAKFGGATYGGTYVGNNGDADWDYVWDDVWEAADPSQPARRRGRRRWGVWAVCWSGLLLILVAGSYAGSAWLAADGMLHALAQRDTGYMVAHLDAAKLMAGLELDLRHLTAQSVAGRGQRPYEGAYLSRMARGTAVSLNDPRLLGRVIQARILDPMAGSAALDYLDNGPRHIVPDSLTSFHVAFDADGRSASGMTLCFTMENLTHLDWRLVQIAWPEIGGGCQRTSSNG